MTADELPEQVDTATENPRDPQDTINRLEETVAVLSNKLTGAERLLSQRDTDISTLARDNEKLSDMVSHLEDDLAALRAQLDMANRRVTETALRIADTERYHRETVQQMANDAGAFGQAMAKLERMSKDYRQLLAENRKLWDQNDARFIWRRYRPFLSMIRWREERLTAAE